MFDHSLNSGIEKLKNAELIVLVDDGAHDYCAYLLCAAAGVSEETISRIVNLSRGVVCVALTEDRIEELGLTPMVKKASPSAPDFMVSVEARQGVSTGISAADRACTIRTLAETKDPKKDLVTPGHIFPIRARRGGVLVRNTVAEAAVDLMSLYEMPESAVLSHCLDESGALLDEEGVSALSESEGLVVVKVSDVIRRRLSSETFVEEVARAQLPTQHAGTFDAYCFRSRNDDAEHLALVKGDINLLDEDGMQQPLLTRVVAEQPISDMFNLSLNQPHGPLTQALSQIDRAGRGVLVYVRHPRKGRLTARVRSFSNSGTSSASNNGSSMTQAKDNASSGRKNIAQELREFGVGAQILSSLGVKRIKLLTNSSRDIAGLDAFGLTVEGRVSFERSKQTP